MKILMITGASRSVVWFRQELIKFLQDKGNDIVVIACDNENKEEIEKLNVEFFCAGGDNRDTGIFSNLSYKNRLTELVKRINPDKIMTFQVKANTFGILASKKAGYKDITAMVEGLGNVYNNSGLKNRIIKFATNFLYKKAFKKVPTVIFLNEDNKNKMLNWKLVKENQCMLINGIGVDLNKFNKEEVPPLDIIKFVMIARVEKTKGVIEFCESAKIIKELGYKNVEFNYYGACDTKINPLNDYKDYVNYQGYTLDIKTVLKNNHIMVLPSYYEGLPRSIMEAMSRGKVILATDIPGCKETIIDGYNGLLVKIKDAQDLSEKMEYLILNCDKISQMGENSRKLCEEKFDSNKINNQIYKRIGEK